MIVNPNLLLFSTLLQLLLHHVHAILPTTPPSALFFGSNSTSTQIALSNVATEASFKSPANSEVVTDTSNQPPKFPYEKFNFPPARVQSFVSPLLLETNVVKNTSIKPQVDTSAWKNDVAIIENASYFPIPETFRDESAGPIHNEKTFPSTTNTNNASTIFEIGDSLGNF